MRRKPFRSDREFPGYPAQWPAIAASVKDSANWRCLRCAQPHDPAAGYTLTVHHLDGDKNNCHLRNLVALCQRCHLHLQAKINVQQSWMFGPPDWLKPYLPPAQEA